MRKALGVLGIVGTVLASRAPGALACGDKFLVVGRTVRTQRLQGAVHRAAILMYVSPGGALVQALKETGLDRQLTLAGHKLEPVKDGGALDRALATGNYDLVLADLSDMTALEPRVGAAPAHPTLLPIVYNPTGEELETAQREYRCVMRSPSTRQGYLAVIEDAMAARLKRNRAPAH